MKYPRLINCLASLLIALTVAGIIAALGAPTWAWVGTLCALYLYEVNQPSGRLRRRS